MADDMTIAVDDHNKRRALVMVLLESMTDEDLAIVRTDFEKTHCPYCWKACDGTCWCWGDPDDR